MCSRIVTLRLRARCSAILSPLSPDNQNSIQNEMEIQLDFRRRTRFVQIFSSDGRKLAICTSENPSVTRRSRAASTNLPCRLSASPRWPGTVVWWHAKRSRRPLRLRPSRYSSPSVYVVGSCATAPAPPPPPRPGAPRPRRQPVRARICGTGVVFGAHDGADAGGVGAAAACLGTPSP